MRPVHHHQGDELPIRCLEEDTLRRRTGRDHRNRFRPSDNPGNAIPTTVTSAPIHSGRYDEIRVSFSNSTVIIPGSQPIPISAPPRLSTNMTLPVPPGGVGDILLVVGFDYSTLFSGQPSLSFVLVRASAV